MAAKRPVFVYGTLRAGERNHELIADTAVAAPAWLDGHALHGHGLAHPYVAPSPRWTVRGELRWPPEDEPDAWLARLDRLEGFAGDGNPTNHYDRVVRVCRADGAMVGAWVYLAGPDARTWLPRGADRRVASGDWRDARRGG